MRDSTAILSALFLAAAPGASWAFAPALPVISSPSSSSALFSDSTGWDSFERARTLRIVPVGEDQRKYRRTVYTHDDWKEHRRSDRFVVYLTSVLQSGAFYRNFAGQVLLATAIAASVCAYNGLVGGYVDLSGAPHEGILEGSALGIPLSAFTITSPSLGLLLVFRTNTSYKRWDEARKNWGMNINHTRDLVRMANAYYDSTGVDPEKRADDMEHIALSTWAFVRCMKRHLSPEDEDELNFQIELYEKLPKKQAQGIISSIHRPNRALQDLSYAINSLPMHFMRQNAVQEAVTIFEDNLGSSERLLTSPVPLFYTRHLSRFLAVWLFLLPFGIYDVFKDTWNHIAMVPAMSLVAIMLFGIDEIGTQLEEPFTVLPMQAFCNKIYNWCLEIASWSPGDNGRATRPVKPEHATFIGDEGPPPPLFPLA